MKLESLSLVEGAVDMHVHAYPEVALSVPARMDDVEALELARDYGLRGLVLKSHLLPTIGKAYYLQKLVPEVSVFSSITLNTICGGLDPVVVEHAAELGAKVIHLPTWTSKNDLESGLFSGFVKEHIKSARSMDSSQGLTVLNSDGSVRGDVTEILEMARELGLVVFTGHLAKSEILCLCEEAQRIGYEKVVWCHAWTERPTEDELLRAASLGAYIEFAFLGMLPVYQYHDAKTVARIVSLVTPERVIMSSDHFSEMAPHPAEMLRMFAATMLQMGVRAEDIRTMMVRNPCKLLDLE